PVHVFLGFASVPFRERQPAADAANGRVRKRRAQPAQGVSRKEGSGVRKNQKIGGREGNAGPVDQVFQNRHLAAVFRKHEDPQGVLARRGGRGFASRSIF